MKLTIREAHVENDRDELIQFLRENLTKDSDEIRFDWLYKQNPCGRGRAWIAVDSDSGNWVGVAAAFPRQLWSAGAQRTAWVLGDFCISNQSRSLGPAMQLQRACLSSLNDDTWYDFPSRSMMAIYKRMGVEPIGEITRYAKLLRIDGKIEDLVPAKSVARAVSVAGNTLLRVRSRVRVPEGMEFSLFQEMFGAEFDALNSRMLRDQDTQGIRTSEFLNWRYRNHPSQHFMIVAARRRSELVGYVAVAVQEPEATVNDVQAADESTIPAMLDYVSQVLIEKNINTLSAPMMANSILLRSLRSAGFSPREGSPVVTHGISAPGCLLFAGDRDS